MGDFNVSPLTTFSYGLLPVEDLSLFSRYNSLQEMYFDATYAGFKNIEPDERLIWMYAFEETGIDRESPVYRFFPLDADVYWFPDMVSWYYTTTYDPLAKRIVISLGRR